MSRSPSVRERTEELERARLATWASLASETKGRDRFEEPSALRTVYQQDRDRLSAARALEALQDKAATLVADETDQRRSQLLHTMQVAALARRMASGLRLNEDLTEAVALGHALGAPAFAAAGVEALATFSDPPFSVPEQSLRIVERLEAGGRGCNLTWEVRDGIVHQAPAVQEPATCEGQLVRVAARIVTASGDLDAAVRAGLLDPAEVPDDAAAMLGRDPGEPAAAALIADVVAGSLDRPTVELDAPLERALTQLERLLAERVYRHPSVGALHDRAMHCMSSLVVYYLEHPERVVGGEAEVGQVAVIDAVAAATEARALTTFTHLFTPHEGGAASMER